MKIKNNSLEAWVKEVAAKTRPDRVVPVARRSNAAYSALERASSSASLKITSILRAKRASLSFSSGIQ